MKRIVPVVFCAALFSGAVSAQSFEDTCLQVSEQWGTSGDIPAQCSCLAGLAGADSALEEELLALADNYSNDEEAYAAGSDAAKQAFDACSVDS